MDEINVDDQESAEEPTPFPGAAAPQKSNLQIEMENFGTLLNNLKQTHRIQIADGIQLLALTLNYNITLRQMGFGQKAPEAPQQEEDTDGEG